MTEVVASIEAAVIAFQGLKSVYKDVCSRYENFNNNPQRVQLCDDDVRAVEGRLSILSTSFTSLSPFLSTEARHLWHSELQEINDAVRNATCNAQELASLLPSPPLRSSTGPTTINQAAKRFVSNVRAFSSANDISARVVQLNTTLAKLRRTIFDRVDRLDSKRIGILSQYQQHQLSIQQQHQQQFQHRGITTALSTVSRSTETAIPSQPIFRPCRTGTIPPLHSEAVLRFDDETTCEGRLFLALKSVMASTSTTTLNSNNNNNNNNSCNTNVPVALGVSGMGGVGKTLALTGLALHPEIQDAFPDGVYFMALGIDANEQHVISSLTRFLQFTNHPSSSNTSSIQFTSLQRAVHAVTGWFQNQSVLFVIDDVWASTTSDEQQQYDSTPRPVGFLPELKGLLSAPGMSRARMVCATRSEAIADEAGLPVTFGSRPVTGMESRSIFLKYAGVSEDIIYGADAPAPHARPIVNDILQKCCGVPLTLGVAGRAVRGYIRDFENDNNNNTNEDVNDVEKYVKGFMAYRSDLYKHGYNVSEDPLGNYPNFRRAVDVSIDLAQRALEARRVSIGRRRRKNRRSDEQGLDISQVFITLCILGKSKKVSVDILAKVWKMPQKRPALQIVNILHDLNLVVRVRGGGCDGERGNKVGGIGSSMYGLHDLVHDYCELCAKEEGIYESLHSSFLDSFLPSKSNRTHPDDSDDNDYDDDFIDDEESAEEKEDEITIESINTSGRAWWTQDLSCPVIKSYLAPNLPRLLLNAGRRAELVSLLTSLDWACFRARRHGGGLEALSNDFDTFFSSTSSKSTKLHSDLTLLRNATRASWPYVTTNKRELRTQAHARLIRCSGNGPFVERYLKSSRKIRFLPLERYWPVPCTREDTSISLHGPTSCVCLRAAAIGCDVVFFDIATKCHTVRWNAHRDSIVALAYVEECNHLVVSASIKGTVKLWRENTQLLKSISVFQNDDDKGENENNVKDVDVTPKAEFILVVLRYPPFIAIWSDFDELWLKWPSTLHQKWGNITCAAFIRGMNKDSHAIAVGLESDVIKILNVKDGNLLSDMYAHVKETNKTDDDCGDKSISHIATSSDGQYGISAYGHDVVVWACRGNKNNNNINRNDDNNPGELRRKESVLCECEQQHKNNNDHTDVSNDNLVNTINNMQSSASTSSLPQQWCHSLPKHSTLPTSLSLSSDGHRACIAYKDGSIKVFDVFRAVQACGTLSHARSPHAIVSSDGSAVISGSPRNPHLRIWNACADREAKMPARAHSRIVRSVSVGKGGHVGVSASRDGMIRLWDFRKWKKCGGEKDVMEYSVEIPLADYVLEEWGGGGGGTCPKGKGRRPEIWSVCVNHDGSRIVTAMTKGDVRVWDCSALLIPDDDDDDDDITDNDTDEWTRWKKKGKKSNDIKTLKKRTENRSDNQNVDESAHDLLDSMGVKLVCVLKNGADNQNSTSSKGVLSVSMCARGKRIATGQWDGVVTVWDDRGRKVGECGSGRGKAEVNSLDMSEDGKWTVWGGGSGMIHGMYCEYGESANEILQGHWGGGAIRSVRLGGCKGKIICGGHDGRIIVWDLNPNNYHERRSNSNNNINNNNSNSSISSSSGSFCSFNRDNSSGGLNRFKGNQILRGHEGIVRGACMNESGTCVVSAGMDSTIRIWNYGGGGSSSSDVFDGDENECGGDDKRLWKFESIRVPAEVFSLAISECEEQGDDDDLILVMAGLTNGQVLLHYLNPNV